MPVQEVRSYVAKLSLGDWDPRVFAANPKNQWLTGKY